MNSKFGIQPGRLLSKYGIDLKEAIQRYPFDESIIDKKDGFEDCIEDDTIKSSDISKVADSISKQTNNPKIIN